MALTMLHALPVVTATSLSSLKSHLAKLSSSSLDRLTAVCSAATVFQLSQEHCYTDSTFHQCSAQCA